MVATRPRPTVRVPETLGTPYSRWKPAADVVHSRAAAGAGEAGSLRLTRAYTH